MKKLNNIDVEKKKKNDTFYVHIITNHYEQVTRERDPNDEWDGDDISHEYNIEGFEVVNEKAGWDFVLNENPTGNWYLVCAYFSTGDTFHHEEGCLSLVSFVKNIEDAKAIVGAIEKDYKDYQEKEDWNHKPLVVHLPVANKDEQIYTGTWKGYFERLSYAEVKCLGENMKVVFNVTPFRINHKSKQKR